MESLIITKSAPLPQESEIKSFEKQFGIKLPATYRHFLLTRNVIYADQNNFIRPDGLEYQLDGFYPFSSSHKPSFQSTNLNMLEFYEGKYLAFAHNSGGVDFVISVQQADYGKIYFCFMDSGLADGLELLANSFEEFIGKLSYSEEEEEDDDD